jgi:hypothetical protein
MQTTSQINIDRPRQRVCDLYCCHDSLPLWSPGFISVEHAGGPAGAVGAVYRQVYTVEGKRIEERVTLEILDLPRAIDMVSDSGGLTRESRVRFEELDDGNTRMRVQNSFAGEHLPYLVHEDLLAYTQRFLELFKAFAEGQGEG